MHTARIRTEADGMAFPTTTGDIEEENASAFALAVAKEIESQIIHTAGGQPVDTDIMLHIQKGRE